MMNRRILFPTDLTEGSLRSLAYAIALARQSKAELHLFHAIILFAEDPYNPAYHFPDVDRIFQDIREKSEAQLNELLAEHQASDIKVVQCHQRGVAAGPMILEYAGKNEIDLIVMSTHGRRGLSKVLIGSVAEEVVQLANCAVLTLNPKCERVEPNAVDRILVPIDFSDHSRKALDEAAKLADQMQAKLMLLHVIEDSVMPPFYMVGVDHLLSATEISDQAESELSKMADLFKTAPKGATIHVARGRAAHEIVRFCERQNVDLIVMSTHGLTGLEHFLLGSVAEKVVRSAPCAVLTLKAFESRKPSA